MIQVNVPIFFYFAEIPKLTEIWPKNRFYSHTPCVWAWLSVSSNIFLAGPSFMEVILHQNIENKKVPKWSKSMFQIFIILPKSQNWPKIGQKNDLISHILCVWTALYKKNVILHKNLVNKKGPTWSKSMFQFFLILTKSQNWPKYGQKTDLIVILCAYG